MSALYHFIGIGGIGMSALARILIQKGCRVKGSDRSDSPLLNELRQEGIAIRIGHSAAWVEAGSTLVFTTALDAMNPELVRAKEWNLPLLHRSDLLDQLVGAKKPLLIAGTHGKTTTTALVASILLEAGFDPSFVVGGIAASLRVNGREGKGLYFVAEADESDGSFLRTPSFGAIVTNCDDDHLDYWKTKAALQRGFGQFFSQVQDPEHLFWCGDDPALCELQPRGFSYGFSSHHALRILTSAPHPHGICFTLAFQGRTYPDIALALWGQHNACNAAAAFGLALSLGIPEEAIRRAFGSFQGTKRRLEWKGEANQIAVFDDYGHHPTEIRATLAALRARMGNPRLVVLFQPHRYTRVRDLYAEFSHAFGEADRVILTDIYGAGEAPIPGITTSFLQEKMEAVLQDKLHYLPRSSLTREVAALLQPSDVVLTLGAGDITEVGASLLHILRGDAI